MYPKVCNLFFLAFRRESLLKISLSNLLASIVYYIVYYIYRENHLTSPHIISFIATVVMRFFFFP